MTETEWLACTNPFQMLRALRRKASPRKRRLFAVACCRRIWHLLDATLQQTIREAERLANLPARREDWTECRRPAIAWAKQQRRVGSEPGLAYFAVLGAADADTRNAVTEAASQTMRALLLASAQDADARLRIFLAERQTQADLLRDIFWPFEMPIVEPAWLAWNAGAVAHLAQAIYEEGRWQDLPILADALEEAGCTDAAILDHLRSPGPHVRGCWALDLALVKKA
jgi:hypothetical protein